MSQLCWTSLCSPLSLSNVGMDALCMQSDNAISFIDLQTKARVFYKADSPSLGAGISVICGHSRFPLVAFAEAVLRPNVFVIKYPELTKFATYWSPNNIKYTDMRFSLYDHLVLLTGYPLYTIKVWNFRTGQMLAELDTHGKYAQYSLLCSGTIMPSVLLYSKWFKRVTIYDTCLTGESFILHEVAQVSLPKRFMFSHIFSMAFGDDRVAYIVDDHGSVWSIQSGQISFKPMWSPNNQDLIHARRHYLYYIRYRNGFLVGNDEMYSLIIKKKDGWTVNSVIEREDIQLMGGIEKALSNFNTEVYVVNQLSAVKRIEYNPGRCKLVETSSMSCRVVNYILIKGLKEEAVLVLSIRQNLRLFEMMRMTMYSFLHVPDAKAIASHNVLPIVSVGNMNGLIQFISYENIRAPIYIGSIDLETTALCINMMDRTVFVYDAFHGIQLVYADYKKKMYFLKTKLERMKDIHFVNSTLTSDSRALLFVSKDTNINLDYAEEMWIYTWEKEIALRTDYNLPHKYRNFVIPMITNKELIDIYALRVSDSVVDCFQLKSNNDITLVSTIKTTHLSNLFGIAGSRNLVSWGVDGIMCHFRQHKKSPQSFHISRFLQTLYNPKVIQRAEECFNGKYLIVFFSYGSLKVYKMSLVADNLRENIFLSTDPIPLEVAQIFQPKHLQKFKTVKIDPTPEEHKARYFLEESVKKLENEISDLIEYDISVTGKTTGIYKKFCLNKVWLEKLNEEAKILFEAERKSLEDSIADQSRIRDWLLSIIISNTSDISVKLRSIFAHNYFENYSMRKERDDLIRNYKYFRFFDMSRPTDDYDEDEETDEPKKTKRIRIKLYDAQGNSVYDHVMRKEFAMQDLNIVSSNQIQNHMFKYKPLVADALRLEFNKIFLEAQNFKQEMMDNILNTNATLNRIYSNMNCMLCLLKMNTFTPPELSVPSWEKDEILEKIMTVDDSEIKAINRRKKKAEVQAFKSGRMLLWPPEFWARALMVMMDGVLEKLWEEEIKKDVPIPEFMIKRQPHEYTLEDQRALREYEEKVRLLELDRRKYLGMLKKDEKKTNELKKKQILKLNAKICEMSVLKLKYDFALKFMHMRILNTKIEHMERVQLCDDLSVAKQSLEKCSDYTIRCASLADYWERAVIDLRMKADHLAVKEKQFERQFKTSFLNPIPVNVANEMLKLFKKRPKMTQRSFNIALVCFEMASRLLQKSSRHDFPLPNEVMEYFTTLEEFDQVDQSPPQCELKHWEAFVKQRRQKIEIELKLRGTQIQLMDAQNAMSAFIKDVNNLKYTREDLSNYIMNISNEYMCSIRNRRLQITLNMGQMEVGFGGTLHSMYDNVLMNIKDVEAVNALIKQAGLKKLQAMQKVALFRRQVLFKEWQHKVIRANIEYLKYMLEVISKCKVTMEFLQIIRNWKQARKNRELYTNVGSIERVVQQRIDAYRKHLDRICAKIEKVKIQIADMKLKNQLVTKEIDEVRVDVTMLNVKRDVLFEERHHRERQERMSKIIKHHSLMEKIRNDYVHLLELRTILELQRLRTFPTLGPAPSQCEK